MLHWSLCDLFLRASVGMRILRTANLRTDENGWTYSHDFFHHTIAHSF